MSTPAKVRSSWAAVENSDATTLSAKLDGDQRFHPRRTGRRHSVHIHSARHEWLGRKWHREYRSDGHSRCPHCAKGPDGRIQAGGNSPQLDRPRLHRHPALIRYEYRYTSAGTKESPEWLDTGDPATPTAGDWAATSDTTPPGTGTELTLDVTEDLVLLTTGTVYYFQVRAVNVITDERFSPDSNTASGLATAVAATWAPSR